MASDLTPFLSHATDRSRASYFTHKEKLIILENFENYKDVFRTKANTAVASKAREECWKKIAECVNSSGSSNVPRTWRQIKTKYKNLLQSAHRRHKRQIREANQTNQDAQVLESLQGGVQSHPAFHSPQEVFVQVDGNTMVVMEPHNLVSPQTEVKGYNCFGVFFPTLQNKTFQTLYLFRLTRVTQSSNLSSLRCLLGKLKMYRLQTCLRPQHLDLMSNRLKQSL
ncbi:hypothetical protein NQD34_005534 [Periophthalmus magnuspinnatus]|nr:hypothetical protein NQD34_005534 [Periophthalmus magnuspinnatus]